jgi:signal transduction histidine kinase/ActR/RegA family two-component response regulator/HAMP domain-containing protein
MTEPATRRVSIRTALIAGFCLTAGVSIVFFGVQRYIWMTGALEREEREQDLVLARAVAAGLDRFLENTRHVAEGLAADVAARQLLEKPSLLQETAESAVRRELAFDSLAVIDDAGTAVAIVPRVNAKGESNIGMRLSDRQYFKDTMAALPPSFDVIFGRAHGRPTIGVAAPIRQRGGISGVAAVGLDLEQLRRVVHEADPARSDRLVVVDAHGRVIAHSSREWEANAHDVSSEAVFRAAQSQREGTTDYESLYTGTARSAAFVRMPSTGWVVWASRGPESTRAKMASLLGGLVWSGIAAAVVATVGAILISRFLARPFAALARATQHLASGRFEAAQIPDDRDSKIREVGELLSGFRTMAERLRRQHEDLEGQVSERTRALEQRTAEALATTALLRAQETIQRGYGELAALLNSLDRSFVLGEGIRKIAATVEAPLVAVYLTGDGPAGLRLKTYAGVDAGMIETSLLSPAGLPQEVARRREPVVLSLAPGAGSLALRTGVGVLEATNVVGLPLQYQDRFVGVLVVATLQPPSEQARHFLTDAARQLSVALNNAALFESVRYQSQQLEALNADLKRASEVKSDFLASMSHELRTPLNSIIGFTELLLTSTRDTLSDRQRAALERVRESGRHLLGLINEVLDLSKIEAGRMDVSAESFALPPLIHECLGAVEPQAHAKGLRVHATGLEGAPEIVQDRGKVKQILINLLSNAVKFTDRGSVELHVERPDAASVSIAVADSGIGISAEDQAVVFDAFRQVGATKTHVPGGTGLGLAISRRLAQLMGGTLTVESTLGQGSTFTLRLPPRHRSQAAAEAIDETSGSAGTTLVLVIDDDRDVATIVRQAVADEPLTVEWAANARDGLARLRTRRPAVILLDVMLQGQDDGWDVLGTLKGDPTTREIPVVVHSVIDNPQRARRLGADEILVKPASPARIRQLLRRYVEASPREAARESV